jgi:hypothetical protein
VYQPFASFSGLDAGVDPSFASTVLPRHNHLQLAFFWCETRWYAVRTPTWWIIRKCLKVSFENSALIFALLKQGLNSAVFLLRSPSVCRSDTDVADLGE